MNTLSTEETLDALKVLDPSAVELLGLDGFHLREEGLEAPIDLILDFTAFEAGDTTQEERVEQAREFVMTYGSPQVRWEIIAQPIEKP